MPIHQEKKIIFIHIPKAAGTSVEIAIGAFGLNNSGDNSIFCPSVLFGHTMQHMVYSEIDKSMRKMKLSANEYESLCIVRHPADRMLSEYRWRVQWDEEIKSKKFTDFCKHFLLDTNLREMNFDNRHFVPQHLFPGPGTRIFKQEDGMDNVSSFLEERGFSSPVGKHNATKSTFKSDFWEDNIEALKLIEHVYEQDYVAFGYECGSRRIAT